ncbi:BTAD domain-containing putative transcriptional regulator [Streptomyces sp. NPDC088727]|uniref:AfsR/SARP family transcriptional regulator n=1 Tax=Streptomyces sp. NPDC088727 TaxID=3365875 RepID=UPI0038226A71
MDMDALGALDVRENGVSITPTAPKPRQVLALLALHADQVVPVSVLVEELWGSTPPRSARTTLQTYVLQVRDLIAVALLKDPADGPVRTPKDVLVTAPGGYMLVSGEGVSDVRQFDRLAGLGYRAMDAGDYPMAAETLRQALDLWTGLPFSGVQAGGQLGMEVKRLEESRLCALDQRIDADLRLGRHRELLAELTVLVSRYRTHENLHAQFMIALYRSGRRGEALGLYRRLRTTLVQELGLEPSARLARLQKSLLASPVADGRAAVNDSVLPLGGAGAVPIS